MTEGQGQVANGNGTVEPSLDLLLHHYPDTIFLESNGVIAWVSGNVRDVLGTEPAALTGSSLESITHPDYQEALEAARDRLAAGLDATVILAARQAHDHHSLVEVRLRPHVDDGVGCDVVGAMRPLADNLEERGAIAYRANAPRLLADRAGDVVFVVDGNGMVLEVGANVVELLGWSINEVTGITLPELIHPDDRPAVAAYRDAVRHERAKGSLEIRVRTRGGTWRWVLAAGVLLSPPGTEAAADVRVMVSYRDIDRLVRVVRFAERESARLRAIIDSALDPWMMLEPLRDQHGHITEFSIEEANAAACEYLRWPHDQLVGARLLAEFPGMVEHGLMDAYVDAMESGAPLVLHHFSYPHEIFGETRRYEIRAHAAQGSLMLTWRDTTSSSRASDELAEAESHFRAMALATGDAVVFVVDGVVEWASPGAEALGLVRSASFTEVMRSLVTPDDDAGVRTCSLLMEDPAGYRGRWHRSTGPALTVRARPVAGEGAVVTLIEESWTVDGPQQA